MLFSFIFYNRFFDLALKLNFILESKLDLLKKYSLFSHFTVVKPYCHRILYLLHHRKEYASVSTFSIMVSILSKTST